MAATTLGALMTILTVCLYLPIWILTRGGTTPEIMEAINYVFDTLIYAGAALALASALPRDPERAVIRTETASVVPHQIGGKLFARNLDRVDREGRSIR
jgi:hypothetical protein